MAKATEHSYDDNDKCKGCGLTKNYIDDNKITSCKGRLKTIVKPNSPTKNKKYI